MNTNMKKEVTEAQKYNPNPNYSMACLVAVSHFHTVILELAQWIEKTKPKSKGFKGDYSNCHYRSHACV